MSTIERALARGRATRGLGYGRFMQADPLGYEAGMNLYGYVRGDPINRIDPSGLEDIDCNTTTNLCLPRGDDEEAIVINGDRCRFVICASSADYLLQDRINSVSDRQQNPNDDCGSDSCETIVVTGRPPRRQPTPPSPPVTAPPPPPPGRNIEVGDNPRYPSRTRPRPRRPAATVLEGCIAVPSIIPEPNPDFSFYGLEESWVYDVWCRTSSGGRFVLRGRVPGE